MNKSILVLGGTGYIGKHIIRSLTKNGHDVVATSHGHLSDTDYSSLQKWWKKGSGSDKQDIAIEPVDLSNKTQLTAIFKKYNFDYIIHAAGGHAYHTTDQLQAVNVTGTDNIINILKKHKVKKPILYLSSIYVMDPTYSKEEGRGEYGKTKLIAEQKLRQYAQENDGNVTILRLTNVWGGHEQNTKAIWPNLIRALSSKDKPEQPMNLWQGGNIGFIHVRDIAHLLTSFIKHDDLPNKTLFVNDTWRVEIADMLYKLTLDALQKKGITPHKDAITLKRATSEFIPIPADKCNLTKDYRQYVRAEKLTPEHHQKRINNFVDHVANELIALKR